MTFDEPRARAGRLTTLLWAFGVLLLLTLLLAQAFWWDRGTWLKDASVRALLERVCTTPFCSLPLPRLAGTIEILHPVMSEHPQRADALRLQLTLINRSDVLQRLPLLQLELYDGEGSLTAARRFTPAEYRPQTPRTGIEPGAAVNLLLELAAPATPPTGFRLKLY